MHVLNPTALCGTWRALLLGLLLAAAARAGAQAALPVVVTGGADQMIRVWDRAGRQAASFLAHDGAVLALAVTRDGRQIVSGGEDKTVKFWNAEDGLLETSLDAHAGSVACLHLSPSGALLATGGADHFVKIWNAATGRLVKALPGHSQPVRALAWSPDGRLLASAGNDRLIQVWTADGMLAGTIVNEEPVAGLGWSHAGQLVAAAIDGTLKAWRSGDYAVAARGRTGDRALSAAAVSPDGRLLATCSTEGRLRVVEIGASSFTPAAEASCQRAATALAWSADGSVLVAAVADRTLRYWSVRGLAPLAKVSSAAVAGALAVAPR